MILRVFLTGVLALFLWGGGRSSARTAAPAAYHIETVPLRRIRPLLTDSRRHTQPVGLLYSIRTLLFLAENAPEKPADAREPLPTIWEVTDSMSEGSETLPSLL